MKGTAVDGFGLKLINCARCCCFSHLSSSSVVTRVL